MTSLISDSSTMDMSIQYEVTNLGQQYYGYEYPFNMTPLTSDSSTMDIRVPIKSENLVKTE